MVHLQPHIMQMMRLSSSNLLLTIQMSNGILQV